MEIAVHEEGRKGKQLMEELNEKLKFEYEIFYMDCMRQSRAGIFARSAEIERKKQLPELIKRCAGEETEQIERLLTRDNLLEEAYRYVEDSQAFREPPGEDMEKVVRAWMQTGY